jgi:hypothetical protein
VVARRQLWYHSAELLVQRNLGVDQVDRDVSGPVDDRD